MRILKGIVLSIVAILLVFVILEIVIIIFESSLTDSFYEYDPDIGFRVKPYANNSNQFGFNDQDYPLKKPDGTYRIIILGDSFGWAGGRKKNYTFLLEERFKPVYGKKLEVINTGYPMTHTGEQFEILRKYAIRYNPDMVLLGFCAGNDFFDANPYRKRVVLNGTYFDVDSRKEISIFGMLLLPKSRLFEFIKQKLVILISRLKAQSDREAPAGERGFMIMNRYNFLRKLSIWMQFWDVSLLRQGYFQGNIYFIQKQLTTMNNYLKARGVPLYVVIFPVEFQVNPDLFNEIVASFPSNRSNIRLDAGQLVLKNIMEPEKIPYLDLLEPFREAAKEKQLYLKNDTHWNDAGNELAAEVIFHFMNPILLEKMK